MLNPLDGSLRNSGFMSKGNLLPPGQFAKLTTPLAISSSVKILSWPSSVCVAVMQFIAPKKDWHEIRCQAKNIQPTATRQQAARSGPERAKALAYGLSRSVSLSKSPSVPDISCMTINAVVPALSCLCPKLCGRTARIVEFDPNSRNRTFRCLSCGEFKLTHALVTERIRDNALWERGRLPEPGTEFLLG